jgi:hypothetical protein
MPAAALGPRCTGAGSAVFWEARQIDQQDAKPTNHGHRRQTLRHKGVDVESIPLRRQCRLQALSCSVTDASVDLR